MKAPDKKYLRWAVRWEHKNRLDGHSAHLAIHGWTEAAAGNFMHLFGTRRAAQAWRDKEYGYLRQRPDLRREPFGWKYPRVVRVTVTVKEI